jgi:Tfp pilus assembly protein PilF
MFRFCLALVYFQALPCHAGGPDLRAKLADRCLVWRPEKCSEVQKKADLQLIKSIERKTPRGEAAKLITQKAWGFYLKEKDPLTALYRFNQALILDPKLGQAWWGAGTILVENGQGGDGEKLILKGAALDPTRAEPHVTLGRYYFLDKKNPPAAGRELEAAVRLNPKIAEAHLWMARVLVVQKKLEDSARSYEKARSLGAPADPELEERLKR